MRSEAYSRRRVRIETITSIGVEHDGRLISKMLFRFITLRKMQE